MKNLIMPIAYTIGGLFLLTGSFFLFAALSGTPLSEMAMVGDYFPDDEEGAAAAIQDVDELSEQLEQDRRSTREVVEAAASPLRSFVIASPFSSTELTQLEERLQLRMKELDRRENTLVGRERKLESEQQHVEDLYAELETLRNQVLAEMDEIDALQDEVARDAAAAKEREEAALKAVAPLFEGGEATTSARMLIDGYTAEEAGQILATLDDARVQELLEAVHKIDKDLFVSFMSAYRAAK